MSIPNPVLGRWRVGLVVFLGAIAAAGFAIAQFDTQALKPRIIAMVERQTGRVLTIAGPVGLLPGLTPRLSLDDVTLANRPGGSAPEMLRVERVEIDLSLLALLARRVELRRVALHAPALLLETDADGTGNWVLTRPAAPAAAEPAGGGPPMAPGLALRVERLAIEAGTLRWRDGRSGAAGTLALPRLTLDRTEAGGVALAGSVGWRDTLIAVAGTTGDPALLAAADPARPLPVTLQLALGEASLALSGQLGPAGWDTEAVAAIPDLAALAPLLPAAPPLRDLAVRARLAGGFAAVPPRLDALQVTLGAGDLGALHGGLALVRLTAVTADATAPLLVAAEATQSGLPVRLEGQVGSPNLWLGAAPVPVALRLAAAAAVATVEGTVADLAVRASIPALAALGPLAGVALPGLTGIEFAAQAAAAPGGVVLRDLKLASSAGDLAGGVTLRATPRPAIEGQLASRRIDLAALRPPAATPSRAAPAPAPTAAPAPAPTGAPRIERLIPATAFPLAPLRQADAALRWTITELAASGPPWRGLDLRIDLAEGRLRLGIAGPLRATVTADAAATPPALGLDLAAVGDAAEAVLVAAGLPLQAAGRAELAATLRGTGSDLPAAAGSMTGSVAVGLTDARIAGRLLAGLPRELRAALLPAESGGDLPLRCVALRAEAEAGRVTLRQAVAELPAGRLGATGGVDLRDERVAMRLLPDLRLGPIALRAPVDVGGTLAAPRFGVSAEGAIAGGLGALLGLQRTPDRGLQALAEALGGAPPALPDCDGPGAAASRPVGPIPGVPAPVQDLLRGLLGR